MKKLLKPILFGKKTEPRFPLSAQRFINALLNVQRSRFEAEIAANKIEPEPVSPNKPTALHILAEDDRFVGSGWSEIIVNNKGTKARWTGRLGTLGLNFTPVKGAKIVVKGTNFTRGKFLKNTKLYLEDIPLDCTIKRKGIKGFEISAQINEVPDAVRSFHILRIQPSGLSAKKEGVDGWASICVSEIEVIAP